MVLNSCGPAGIAGRAIFPGGASANIETNIYIIKGIRETDGSLFSFTDLCPVYFTDIGPLPESITLFQQVGRFN